MKSCFRSVDMEFEANLQEINRRYLFFQEEVTLIHRQHLENHMVQQNTANMAIYGATCNSEGQTVGVNIDCTWQDLRHQHLHAVARSIEVAYITCSLQYDEEHPCLATSIRLPRATSPYQ